MSDGNKEFVQFLINAMKYAAASLITALLSEESNRIRKLKVWAAGSLAGLLSHVVLEEFNNLSEGWKSVISILLAAFVTSWWKEIEEKSKKMLSQFLFAFSMFLSNMFKQKNGNDDVPDNKRD